MMNERQIEMAADMVVGALRAAAQGETNVADGVVSCRIGGSEIIDHVAPYGQHGGIWGVRHSMAHVCIAVAQRLGLSYKSVEWECDGRPALDKGYVFKAPAFALAEPAAPRSAPGSVASEVKLALAQAAEANRKTAKFAEALAALCSAAEPAPGIPDAFILRRADVLLALDILNDKPATTNE